MEGGVGCGMERLSADDISYVLSLISPADACRSAAVSAPFRSAAESDNVWARFLPSDHRDIVSRAVDPVAFSSKKDLYFLLCNSILIDGGRKSFALEKHSGAKCYTLSARDLSIVWGDHESYWRWVSLPESRFAEVAELWDVCWLDIRGKIDCGALSSCTAYKAYLIFKLTREAYGFKRPPQQVSVSIGPHIVENEVCLQPENPSVDHRVPRARNDGWMEIEIGDFFVGDGSEGEVTMSFRQVRSMHWKRGLIVEGIQVRPR
ncbi:F-box protein PP2-B10-like [Iris pallida]|uniref:F-box protein PP2-B10-like n=1 Tax=Iris pallida TaxID=29817 RepID=A0AAX6FUY2_IRIPA|nr:F-box protein PP2-B10-like [Iris pallida]